MSSKLAYSKNDQPLTEKLDDTLGYTSHIEGVATFISECATPLTLAVQGPWGSGKTSFLYQVTGVLSSEKEMQHAHPIMFNTWQYSQFDMGEDLVLSLLYQFIDQIVEESEKASKSQATEEEQTKTKKSFYRWFRSSSKPTSDDKKNSLKDAGKKLQHLLLGLARSNVLNDTLSTFVPVVGTAVKAVNEIGQISYDALTSTRSEEKTDFNLENKQALQQKIQTLSTLKTKLEEFVLNYLKIVNHGKEVKDRDRIVFMIDDLDRLDPKKAVELMEAIKLFLDIEHCVFVLAIDFEVVKQGVKAKYGRDFNDVKAEAFFEKIIQVPFNLPTNKYSLDEYLREFLDPKNNRANEIFTKLIEESTGKNPRTLKRILNTYSLIDLIQSKEKKYNNSKPKVSPVELISVLCFQNAFPVYYRYFESRWEGETLEEKNNFESKILTDFQFEDDNPEDLDSKAKALNSLGVEERDQQKLRVFLEAFAKLFLLNDNRSKFLTDEEKNEQAYLKLGYILETVSVVSLTYDSDDRGGIVTSLAQVEEVLVQKDVRPELIELFRRIYFELYEKLGQTEDRRPRVTPGIGIQPEAKLYANPDANPTKSPNSVGTFSEITFRRNSLAIRLHKHFMGEPVLESMVKKLELAGFGKDKQKISKRDTKGNFRIELQQIPADLSEEKLEVLIEVLAEARNLTAEKNGWD
ncbi:hypothetical protein BSR29_07585 [Boudabousia liubingyangii]|uniref:KAP NTPase domain-containing protein n=1 Tax=Boudabousia liubingyangii TaxID=1921764 RepID=A0A1Q5PKD3_9ACTO|nr:P-loop NTPase fold protein [Boudabousia liubingyangii]OKL46667.1 hypothetical protein BSR29_07585 [Boudabousia liubingyangii]